jgi:hypothetical protein
MSYRALGGRWCNIALNVHAPSEEKSDDLKDSFREELKQIFPRQENSDDLKDSFHEELG